MIVLRVVQKHLKDSQDKHPVSLKWTLLVIWHRYPREPGFSLTLIPEFLVSASFFFSLSPKRSWLGPEAGVDRAVAEKVLAGSSHT